MRRKLLTFTLMFVAAVLVACGGNAEPAVAPAESQSASESGATDAAGSAGDAPSAETGDAQTGGDAAGQPKFVEFYADW